MFGYVVFNVLAESADMGILLYPTDKLASVDIPLIVSNRKIPLDECRLYRVCEYDPKTMSLKNCTPELVEWDCRRLKETPMTKLSPDVVTNNMNSVH